VGGGWGRERADIFRAKRFRAMMHKATFQPQIAPCIWPIAFTARHISRILPPVVNINNVDKISGVVYKLTVRVCLCLVC